MDSKHIFIKMNIFITYSYDSQDHVEWVGKLADELDRQEDFHVILDQYDLDVFKEKNLFMEDGVTKADVILVVATKDYKRRADERKRGVGIETQLAAQRHYSEISESGSSNVVVIQRERDSIPVYLMSKIYIDFSEDRFFAKSLKQLTQALHKQPTRGRPQKDLSREEVIFNEMTRIEDVLKIIYHKRKVLIGVEDGRDYSGSNRIKFELWEVRVPKVEHILILYDHIIIQQTLDRAFELIRSKGINIESITVIRVDDKTSESLEQEILKRDSNVNVSQYTLKEFIREFCMDSDLTTDHRVWQEPFFIDQPLYQSLTGEEDKLDEHAIPYLRSKIDSPTKYSAHLILGEGGDGKSSLCSSLVNAINNHKSQLKKNAVLLRIDEIRERISVDVAHSFQIKSVHDIYDLFSLLLGQSDKGTNYPKLTKNEFEVSVFCGNLVVVIDGLDELYSVFQERFDKEAFIESIQSLNDQLGESSIILTSRGNVFSDEIRAYSDIQVCYLRGFDNNECDEYFTKRFRSVEDEDKLKRKCGDSVRSLIKATGVERISPFVVDLIANVNSEQKESLEDGDYSLTGKHYPSNSDFKDKVVFHVLRREKKRQEVHITISEMVGLFCEIAAEYGPSISLFKLQEICEIYYEQQAQSVFSYLKINPLLQVRSDSVCFRYNFLHEYFLNLYLIQGVMKNDYNPCFLNAASKYSDGISAGYKDVRKYFVSHPSSVDFCALVHRLVEEYKKDKKQVIEKAISFVAHLILDASGSGKSMKEISDQLFSCFIPSSNSKAVEFVFIYGDGPPLDFSNRIFMHCGFHGYSSLLRSDLDHAFFSYSCVDIDE